MAPLVLSLFPGIGLLDMAFEEEGFCVVRGPDVIWGGDVRRFHPPAGKFDGVIGGPPCKRFSQIARLNLAQGREPAEDLIPEFERCIAEAEPDWFLMENVSAAPEPRVPGFIISSELLRDDWVGGDTTRLRRFSFGACFDTNWSIETLALHRPDPEPCVTARATAWDKARSRPRSRVSWPNIKESLRLQGLPEDFLHRFQICKGRSAFTADGAQAVLGNGVPIPMGRAVARAVKKALGIELNEAASAKRAGAEEQ